VPENMMSVYTGFHLEATLKMSPNTFTSFPTAAFIYNTHNLCLTYVHKTLFYLSGFFYFSVSNS